MAWDTLSQANLRYTLFMTEIEAATIKELADRMGDASRAEALAMRQALLAEGYQTFEEVSPAAWHRLHEQAVSAVGADWLR